MMWDDGGWSWWGWLLMSVMMVAFWAFIVWAAVTVVRSLTDRQPRAPSDLDPEEILANRFARGEIDAEEYHRRLETLRAPEHAGQPIGSRR
jgi:putative membrane protein